MRYNMALRLRNDESLNCAGEIKHFSVIPVNILGSVIVHEECSHINKKLAIHF